MAKIIIIYEKEKQRKRERKRGSEEWKITDPEETTHHRMSDEETKTHTQPILQQGASGCNLPTW